MHTLRALVLIQCFITTQVIAAPTAKLQWTVFSGFDHPSSAYYDSKGDFIYVSNQSGGVVDSKEGKGWISKLSSAGKVFHEKWATGLNAPKGMTAFGGYLWVADIDRVVKISLKDPKQFRSIEVPGSKSLKDISISKDGRIFLSDMLTHRIYRIINEHVEVFLESPEIRSPSGLLVHEPYLAVVSHSSDRQTDPTKIKGSAYNINLSTKQVTGIVKDLGELDSIAVAWRSLGGGFIITDSKEGALYLEQKEHRFKILEDLKEPGDIDVMLKQKIVLVPEINANRVAAYKINL